MPTTIAPTLLWVAFALFIAAMLALDLGVMRRNAHRIGTREAAAWSVLWVLLAVAFNVGIYVYFGSGPALEFTTGYLIEKALAVDNIFVFAIIFAALRIPDIYQHRVLFWGIIGAVALRAVMIGLGSAVFSRFEWAAQVFGVLLIITGLKFMSQSTSETKENKTPWWVGWIKDLIPVTDSVEGGRFVAKSNGRWMATPLLVALVVVEVSDVIFALDSVPAIFAVTKDPFIVLTSNIFAILGLRSMYFLLASLLDEFAYLKPGLAAVLTFVGLKMALASVIHVPTSVSLAVITLILATSILASIVVNPSPRRWS